MQAPHPAPAAPERDETWRELAPPAARRKQPSWFKRRLGPVLAAIVAFLAKFKAILLLLPKLKLLTTAGTMLVSVAAYSFVFGWPFAAGFVVLIFVHEMGHVIQLRREGMKASAPMFIPFLGAVISARSLGKNALAEARVGLAGPILGSIGSAALHRDLEGDRERHLAGRSRSPASSSTSSTCCRSSRSTAAGRWPRWRRGCGSSASPR